MNLGKASALGMARALLMSGLPGGDVCKYWHFQTSRREVVFASAETAVQTQWRLTLRLVEN